MIDVFCEFGGENALGKAREIADSIGDRVRAVVSLRSIDPQRLVQLGADEVLTCEGVTKTGEWVRVLSSIVSDSKFVIFASNNVSNMIMGALYYAAKDRVSLYLDGADLLETNAATKSLANAGFAFKKNANDKASLVSVNLSSVAPPFEDTSRYGKIRAYEWNKNSERPLNLAEMGAPSNARLTILLGPGCKKGISELSQKLGEKYGGTVQKFSGTTQIVYGPCLAVEVENRVRELPKFEGYLIAINSKKSPISTIADVVVESEDLEKILASM